MKGNELQLVAALVIILTFVMSFAVFETFTGGFTFFLLVPVVTIIYIAIYMTISWKELLK
jgi:hypothetical protein